MIDTFDETKKIMAHLAIFKKFDKLKGIGDSFMLSLKPYKNFNSARGTVTSGATDYRKSGHTYFYVRTENYDGALKVTRVKNGASHTKENIRPAAQFDRVGAEKSHASYNPEMIRSHGKEFMDDFKSLAKETKEKKEATYLGIDFEKVSEQMLKSGSGIQELHNHEKYVAALFNRMGQLCNP